MEKIKVEIKCDDIIKKQCLSEHNSKACKLRYFNGRCMMALKNKAEENKTEQK